MTSKRQKAQRDRLLVLVVAMLDEGWDPQDILVEVAIIMAQRKEAA